MLNIDAYLIISPVLGAIIGYITNWVAIKMLFRPHTEKKMFGKRVPFTPGLIPSRRYVLAKKVGEAISAHLLTDETLIKSLCSDNVKQSVEDITSSLINSIKASDKTILEILFKDNGADTALKDELERFSKKLEDILISDSFFELVSDYERRMFECDKTVEEFLPVTLSFNIKLLINEKVGELSEGIINIIESPFFEAKLKPVILNIIEQNVKGLATLFVVPEKIFGNFHASVLEYFSDSRNYATTAEKLTELLEKVMTAKVSAIANTLSNDGTRLLSSMLQNELDGEGSPFSNVLQIFKENAVVKTTQWILSVKISTLALSVDDNYVNSFKLMIMSRYEDFIISNMPALLKAIDLPLIIEEKINDFEIAEAENIILSVVDRELKAITYFGGLLGFVIGIIPPILRSLGL